MTSYKVEVKAIGGWTTHSEHESYRDAVNQSDMVHGRVVVATGIENSFRFDCPVHLTNDDDKS